MSFAAVPHLALPPGSECAADSSPALAVCHRCGTFVCAACSGQRANLRFCTSCLAHDDVDYLEHTRRRFWGKRDLWTWVFSIAVLWVVLQSVQAVSSHSWWAIAVCALDLAVMIPYVLLRPWARPALALCALPLLVIAARPHYTASGAMVYTWMHAERFASLAVGLLPIALAYCSARNRLAFRLPVSDRQLQSVYERFVANTEARRAAMCAALSLLMPLAGPFTWWMSFRAYRRPRDGSSYPPVRSGGFAVLGLVLSSLSTLLLVSLALALLGDDSLD